MVAWFVVLKRFFFSQQVSLAYQELMVYLEWRASEDLMVFLGRQDQEVLITSNGIINKLINKNLIIESTLIPTLTLSTNINICESLYIMKINISLHIILFYPSPPSKKKRVNFKVPERSTKYPSEQYFKILEMISLAIKY